MTINKILDKLWQDGTEFVSLNRLRKVSKNLYYNYSTMIKYLISRGFLYKVLNDVYYVRSQETLNSVNENLKYTSYELISKALNFIDVENWYFGLYTALRFHAPSFKNNTGDYLIFSNTPVIRNKFIVCEQEFQIIRLKPTLFNFGILQKENEVKYSDLEKTILDLVYLWQSSNTPNHKIKAEIFKYSKLLSTDKIKSYSSHYPDEIKHLMGEILKGASI